MIYTIYSNTNIVMNPLCSLNSESWTHQHSSSPAVEGHCWLLVVFQSLADMSMPLNDHLYSTSFFIYIFCLQIISVFMNDSP